MINVVSKLMLFTLFFCMALQAQPKLQQKPIIVVSSNALTGPAAGLGVKLTHGAEVYFNKVNAQNGVLGQQIKLRTFDDRYEPYKTVENTYKALASSDVLALMNYAGTPNAHAIMPIISKHKVPFLMPFTGAEFLRNPANPYIFNLRASYDQETAAQIEYIATKVKAKKIALVVQSDKFGIALEKSYLRAMANYNLKPVVTARFRRNTQGIAPALSVLLDHDIDAVAFVGTYAPLIELVTQAHQLNFKPFFSSVSFVSSHDLFAGIKVPANIFVTEVMPNSLRCKLAICQEFLQDIATNKSIQPGPVVFEGYLNAKLFVEVARQCSNPLTRDCLIKKMAHFESDFGGLNVKFSPNQHQGLNDIYLSVLEDKNKASQ